ncbi:pyridoxal phosphate-dependent aminotransferase [Shouchella shacheensis]|uniref:pyridoxal phosphate-dependent aminotransferase n=1 Tax=Shouchella shacheensis TaxID=1649580 RepID=UPI00073FB42D|nr:pyridoxal phosphate-dependent aminotransferase [Shouchella shacheensis]
MIQQSKAMDRLPKQFFAALVKKAQEMSAEHDDMINLGQGNHDKPTPSHIVDALKQGAENPAYHRYGPFSGYLFLKEAVAGYYKREYGVELDPKTEVAIVPGTKTGIVELCQCLLSPGEVALVPDPGYPDYWSGIAIAGATMHPMALKEQCQFLPDYRELSDATRRAAKMMFLNYPNNPTGVRAHASFFEKTVAFAAKHEISVVHDFAYGAIGYDEKPRSFLQSEGAKEVGVELFTMSKLYNMAGWRVGFVVGNAQIVNMLETLQDHYHCSIFGGLQEAAAHALNEEQTSVDRLVDMYRSRRDALVKAAREIGWEVTAPQGSFFAWFPVPKGYDSQAFSDLLLEKAHIVTAPGIGFGAHGEGYVRLGLLAEEDVLVEAVHRVGKLGLFKNE